MEWSKGEEDYEEISNEENKKNKHEEQFQFICRYLQKWKYCEWRRREKAPTNNEKTKAMDSRHQQWITKFKQKKIKHTKFPIKKNHKINEICDDWLNPNRPLPWDLVSIRIEIVFKWTNNNSSINDASEQPMDKQTNKQMNTYLNVKHRICIFTCICI